MVANRPQSDLVEKRIDRSVDVGTVSILSLFLHAPQCLRILCAHNKSLFKHGYVSI